MTSESAKKPLVAASFLDRAIAFFSPQRGLARYQAKARVSMLEQTGYIGASGIRRSLRNWFASGASADRLIESAGPTLRDRGHDLLRNNPIAASAIYTANSYVVGTGLKLESTFLSSFFHNFPPPTGHQFQMSRSSFP